MSGRALLPAPFVPFTAALRSRVSRAWHRFEIDHRVRTHRRPVIAAAATVLHVVLYGIPNRFPVFHPVMLPLTPLDAEIPLLPLTAWLYWSDYLLVFVAFIWTEQPVRFIRAFAMALVVAVLMHLLIPTTYPRELFALGDSARTLTGELLQRFRAVDSPISCFPSLHVTLAMVAALAVRRRTGAVAIWVWAIAIAISTLTTKQHYTYDVIGGAVLGAASWFIVGRVTHGHEQEPRTATT